MFKGFFTALSSRVFGSGQNEDRNQSEDHDSSSGSTVKESSADGSVQKTEQVISTGTTKLRTDGEDQKNSGPEVTNELSVTEGKNKTSDQETPHTAVLVKEEKICTISEDTTSPKSDGQGHDMSEWVTLEMPEGKGSQNCMTKSSRSQEMKSSSSPDAGSETDRESSTSDAGSETREKGSTPDAVSETSAKGSTPDAAPVTVEKGSTPDAVPVTGGKSSSPYAVSETSAKGSTPDAALVTGEKGSSPDAVPVTGGKSSTPDAVSETSAKDLTPDAAPVTGEKGSSPDAAPVTGRKSSSTDPEPETSAKGSSPDAMSKTSAKGSSPDAVPVTGGKSSTPDAVSETSAKDLIPDAAPVTGRKSSSTDPEPETSAKGSSPDAMSKTSAKGSTPDATPEASRDTKFLLGAGDVAEKPSQVMENTTEKIDREEGGSQAAGDACNAVLKNRGHLDEESFSSMLVSSVLEDIVGEMSKVTVKDTMMDTKNNNQNANQEHQVDSEKPHEDNWKAKEPHKQRGDYCREKPQRGKKGMGQSGHQQRYNDDKPPAAEEKGDEKDEDRIKFPPIDPNLEKEDFLQFCKISTEHDKLIRAKKLIYKLGYLKNVPQEEIKDVILGQYKIAAKRLIHGWIEDARYFAEVMISKDWIDDNILYLNPRQNKKSANKRNKNRYAEKEDSFTRKTGGLCQDVRLLTNPNLTVVRVNMKCNGQVQKINGDSEAIGTSGKTGEISPKPSKNDDMEKDNPKIEVGDKLLSSAEPAEEDVDKFEDCIEEYVESTNISKDRKESGNVETLQRINSNKAIEEEELVEQGNVTEVVTLIRECTISQEEQEVSTDVQNSELIENSNPEVGQKSELIASNDSFTDPAIIMMVKSSSNSEVKPYQSNEIPAYDPKCDVLSGLFRMEDDSRSLIESIMHSDSPTEPSVTRDNPQAVMMSHGDPTMIMENDSQLVDYLLHVTEEPKNPSMFHEIPCNVENSSDSLAELDGIEDFITDLVTSKICNIDTITDIDTAGISDGGEDVVNLDLVKDENVMNLIEQCQTEDLADGEMCDGAGEAPAMEGQVLEEGESKKSIQHFGDPIESEMVYNLLQDLPILQQQDDVALIQDCNYLSTDHQDNLPDLQLEMESQMAKEPYSPTQGCVESYSPDKGVSEPDTEPISPSQDK